MAETKRIKSVRTGSARGASGSHSQTNQTQAHTQSHQQSHQQQSRRGTRDDRSASGSAQSFLAPQSSATVPSQDSGTRRGVTCFTCGRPGHMSRECRFVRQATPSAPPAERPGCYQCGQQGHIKKSCPSLQGEPQHSGSSSSYQTGTSVTQSP